jgi:hypothetical protein
MGKVKEMVDLKPKAEKITDVQLQELQAVVDQNNAVQFRIGSLETQKHELIHRHSEIQKRIVNIQGNLSKEYGTFDIELSDGTINYPEDGKPRN